MPLPQNATGATKATEDTPRGTQRRAGKQQLLDGKVWHGAESGQDPVNSLLEKVA